MIMATCSMCGGKLPKGQQNPCKKCRADWGLTDKTVNWYNQGMP